MIRTRRRVPREQESRHREAQRWTSCMAVWLYGCMAVWLLRGIGRAQADGGGLRPGDAPAGHRAAGGADVRGR